MVSFSLIMAALYIQENGNMRAALSTSDVIEVRSAIKLPTVTLKMVLLYMFSLKHLCFVLNNHSSQPKTSLKQCSTKLKTILGMQKSHLES